MPRDVFNGLGARNRGAGDGNAHTVVVDATSGKPLWKTKVGDVTKGETITMAPTVVKGKVPAVDEKTAMPDLHVKEPDARDMTSYLYALR